MQEFNTMREGAINNTYLPKNRNVAGKDDIRHVRPLEANITVVLLDVQAELTMVRYILPVFFLIFPLSTTLNRKNCFWYFWLMMHLDIK